MPAFSPIRFYHELRRRRMIKVTLIYLAGAWAAIGACDLLLPQVVVDVEMAMRIVFVLAIVLLPIALLFGWRYDITDQGVRRTAKASGDSATSDAALHRRDHLLIGTLSTAVVAILATGAFSISQLPRVIPAPPENSIAVLPFEICTDKDLDIRLAPALAMEVINHLAERAQLMVIARKSSFTMAGFGLSLPQIAEPLGVRYLLKGELCRDGDIPTLAVDLFDEDGAQVWNHRYQQQTDASNRITQTLPSLVADGVAMQLGGVSAVKPVEPVDSEAYEQLLIGREHRWQGDRDKAREAFERALEIQPDYAEVVFELAWLDIDATDNTIQNFENILLQHERALALAEERIGHGDRSFRTFMVAGEILDSMAWLEQELTWRKATEFSEDEIATRKESARMKYAKAESYYRTSILLNPSVTDTYLMLSFAIERQSIQRRGESLEILERGVDRDPFNSRFNGRVAARWAGRGRYRQAMELLERFKTLPEPPRSIWWSQHEMQKNIGRFDDLGETLIEMLTQHPQVFSHRSGNGAIDFGNSVQTFEFLYRMELLGLSEEAEQWYLRVKDLPGKGWLGRLMLSWYLISAGRGDAYLEERRAELAAMSDEDLMNDRYFLRATNFANDLARFGEYDRAIKLMEFLQHSGVGGPTWPEREMWHRNLLANLYLQVGRDDEAVPLLAGIAEYLEAEYESGIRHPGTLAILASTYVRQKRDDEALEMLRKAVDYGYNGEVLYSELFNPFPWEWERLRDDPRFIVLWNRMEADLEQQAIRIRAMLAEHDVDELLAPLMAFVEEPAAEAKE